MMNSIFFQSFFMVPVIKLRKSSCWILNSPKAIVSYHCHLSPYLPIRTYFMKWPSKHPFYCLKASLCTACWYVSMSIELRPSLNSLNKMLWNTKRMRCLIISEYVLKHERSKSTLFEFPSTNLTSAETNENMRESNVTAICSSLDR